MKKEIKYIFFAVLLFVMGIISINIFGNDKPDKVKGIVHIWVNNNTYDYINQCANEFMKENNKVTIYVDKIDNYASLTKQLNEPAVQNQVKIFQASYNDLLSNGLDKYSYYKCADNIMDIYGANFSENTKKKYAKNYKVSAIPFTSRPLALYVKKDVLEQYGYEISDLNTWDDVKKVGLDIYNKSNNKIKLLSGTKQNYLDVLKLVLLQNIGNESEEKIKENVLNFMNELKEYNLMTVNDTEDYVGKISSVDGINNNDYKWIIGNVPCNGFGSNKFFTIDDTALYVLNNTNSELAEKFIKYIIVEDKMCINHMQNGEFFLTYLYPYKNKQIERKIENVEGQTPLMILSNVETKSIYNDYYDKYETIIKDLE